MKRYSDLTNEELVKLTDEKVRRLIELEVAHEGIIPVDEPELLDVPEVAIEPTTVAFEVYGLYFQDRKDAEALARLPVVRSECNYRINSKMSYLTVDKDNAIQEKKFYRKTDVKNHEDILKEIKKSKEINERRLSSYNSYTSSISGIKSKVWDAVRNAEDWKKSIETAKGVYAKHLDLANGDEAIAKNFFRNAYSDEEVLELVIGDKPESKITEEKLPEIF